MMDSAGFQLVRAPAGQRELLAHLLELYSHDLSGIFGLAVGEDGRFGYPRLDQYWAFPETHHPFVFRYGGSVAGFALVTRGSPVTTDPSDLDMAEFFVLRRYRRMGVGRQAACALWGALPGRWIVRVSEANLPGMAFWESVIRHTSDDHTTRAWENHGHRWRVYSWRPACSNR
jgi:predicted acetyltransferase